MLRTSTLGSDAMSIRAVSGTEGSAPTMSLCSQPQKRSERASARTPSTNSLSPSTRVTYARREMELSGMSGERREAINAGRQAENSFISPLPQRQSRPREPALASGVGRACSKSMVLQQLGRASVALASAGPVIASAPAEHTHVAVLAGTAAGLLSTLISHPLDVLATRRQVCGAQPARRAPRGAFNGIAWALASALVGNAFFFYADAELALLLHGRAGPSAALLRSLGASLVAAAVNTPFEVLKKRAIMARHEASGEHSMAFLADPHFVLANVLPMILGTTTTFTSYRLLCEAATAAGHSAEAPLVSGCVGMASGLLGEAVCAPLNTIKSVVLVSAKSVPPTGVLRAARRIVKTSGARGLFAGLAPSLLRSLVPGFVMFAALPALRALLSSA